MKIPKNKSSLLAITFWVLSLFLAFQIPPQSKYIWLPDSLLLLGFWPLLISSRAAWLWVAFGLCNMIAGMTLALAICIPDNFFAPYHLVEMNRHLKLYHPYMAWLLIGFFSGVIGIIILLVKLLIWLLNLFRSRI